MKRGYDRMVEEVFDIVDEMAEQWPEDIEEEYPGVPYGSGRASDMEFVMLFEERVNGRVARNPVTLAPQFDPATGQPIYEVPPDPYFPLALVATKDGKPIVQGGMDLVKRYERARGVV